MRETKMELKDGYPITKVNQTRDLDIYGIFNCKTIPEVIEALSNLDTEEDAIFVVQQYSDDHGFDSDYYNITLDWLRDETQQEYNRRVNVLISEEKARKTREKNKEINERKLYEKLKKKFGD